MNKAVIFAAAVLILVGGIIYLTSGDESVLPYIPDDIGLPTIHVDGTPLKVLVADTEEERLRGLSGHELLPFNQGMLFVFEEDGLYRIWMKDMTFPLDVMWIDKDGRIVGIKENVAPETYPEAFGSRVPARYVLEVPAGFAEIYNINEGDLVEF